MSSETRQLASTGSAAANVNLAEGDSWEWAVAAANPASLLLVIEQRLGALRSEASAEDVLQDALMRSWHARNGFEWRGHRAFRAYLLTLADRCMADRRDARNAIKRGEGRTVPFSVLAPTGPSPEPPPLSATPSRLAVYAEQKRIMAASLESLPEDVRDVVRLRLFEQRSMTEIGVMLGLSLATVQHRTRRGVRLYHLRLRAAMAESARIPRPTGEATPFQ